MPTHAKISRMAPQKLPDAEKRRLRQIYMTDAEYAVVAAAAALTPGRTISDYVRENIAQKARRDLKTAKGEPPPSPS